MTLEEKKRLFVWGLQLFINRVCYGDQDRYIEFMDHQDGYLTTCKKFYLKSGRMTIKDRDALFNDGVIPDWMKDGFMQVEQQFFGTPLLNNQRKENVTV